MALDVNSLINQNTDFIDEEVTTYFHDFHDSNESDTEDEESTQNQVRFIDVAEIMGFPEEKNASDMQF